MRACVRACVCVSEIKKIQFVYICLQVRKRPPPKRQHVHYRRSTIQVIFVLRNYPDTHYIHDEYLITELYTLCRERITLIFKEITIHLQLKFQ